ncbi:c2h2 finger domain containing protein [Niveomyces insectorum RCEF 264]|uniref:C2h2 finger domain containing protein n=1 Tax=Niveomyces insectorum RCEF 264 TaxID=1081102 RepID=A0A168AGG2_9HYPO|nr:c2h2 finger domain containing protein [Niveomyces insectorum RCEF 264]
MDCSNIHTNPALFDPDNWTRDGGYFCRSSPFPHGKTEDFYVQPYPFDYHHSYYTLASNSPCSSRASSSSVRSISSTCSTSSSSSTTSTTSTTSTSSDGLYYGRRASTIDDGSSATAGTPFLGMPGDCFQLPDAMTGSYYDQGDAGFADGSVAPLAELGSAKSPFSSYTTWCVDADDNKFVSEHGFPRRCWDQSPQLDFSSIELDQALYSPSALLGSPLAQHEPEWPPLAAPALECVVPGSVWSLLPDVDPSFSSALLTGGRSSSITSNEDTHNGIVSPAGSGGGGVEGMATAAETSITIATPAPARKAYVCNHPACSMPTFTRQADLKRHWEHVHKTADEKEQFPCDYETCPRRKMPFSRKDHCRSHLRDAHMEDLVKHGCNVHQRSASSVVLEASGESPLQRQQKKKQQQQDQQYCSSRHHHHRKHDRDAGDVLSLEWAYAKKRNKNNNSNNYDDDDDYGDNNDDDDEYSHDDGRSYEGTGTWLDNCNIDLAWFRCARCLRRVHIAEDGWTCPDCSCSIEPVRKEHRQLREALVAQAMAS